MPERIEIFTDGACRGNPGPGGWGVIVRGKDYEKILCGAELSTTNNRMEMTAVIMALKSLELLAPRCRIRITTDSQYVQKGMTEWLTAWKRRGWKTADNKPIKNPDLWQRLDKLVTQHDIEWQWVRGHHGYLGNERADRLANKAIDEMLQNTRAE